MKALARVPVESLCTQITTGGTPSRSSVSYWEGGNIPWFKTGELKDWYVEDSEEKITEEGLLKSSAKLFPPNTVLMALYGDGRTITSLGLLRDAATTNQACCAMIADQRKCHFLYLFYALKYHRCEILQFVVAGAQRNLSNDIVRKFKIIHHPIPTQCRIVDTLSAYDNLIANNRRRMALLEEAARQLYQEWFVRLRFPGHEHARIINGVPEGWRRVTVGSLVGEGAIDLQTGPFGTQLKAADYADTGTPVINVRNIGYGRLRAEKLEFLPEIALQRLAKHILNVGDLVFGRKGAVDRHTLIGEAQAGWIQGSDCIRLRSLSPDVPPLLMSFAFREDAHKVWMLTQCSNKATMASLNHDVIGRISVLLPSAGILHDFASVASELIEQTAILQKQSEKLRHARDLLLPRLMSGEIEA